MMPRMCSALVVVAMVTITHAIQPEYCKLPPLAGPCRASITRYFFDAGSQDCREFSYGGCNGNANNFQALSECRAACVCSMNYTNALSCMPPYFRQYYNYTQATCLSAVNGACGGVKKAFASYRDCLDTCSYSGCFQLPASGQCRLPSTQYFYNGTSRACERFAGCEGGPNRYSTLEECNRQCAQPISVSGSRSRICALPAARGSCDAALPRYFFNSKTQACEMFTYGGCLGNENNFERPEDCRAFCTLSDRAADFADIEIRAKRSLVSPEDCRLPPDVGLCRGNVKKYYYDSTSRSCATFIYGGCLGNRNNFASPEECHDACDHYFPDDQSAPRSLEPIRESAAHVGARKKGSDTRLNH